MSLVAHLTIDRLIQSSLSNDYNERFEWIPFSDITDIKQSQFDTVHYAIWLTLRSGEVYETNIMLLLVGKDEICTPTFMSEFARIYSLPTHKYSNDVSQFKSYSKWLRYRNEAIKGFTEYEGSYYLVAGREFYRYYSLHGFCSACGILRCSPVWCVCGHKELSSGWTSNNKHLDEFIRKSQIQTRSANEAYLEWIPFDSIMNSGYGARFHGIPSTTYDGLCVKLISLEITDEADESYYDKVSYAIMNILISRLLKIIDSTYNFNSYVMRIQIFLSRIRGLP